MLAEETGPTHKPPSDSQHKSRHRTRHDIPAEVAVDRQSKDASDGLRSMNYYQNWVNGIFLPQEIGHIDNLTAAFSNGKFIVTLTQLIIGEKISGVKNDPAFLKQKLENTQKCLGILATKGMEIEEVTAEDLVHGKRIAIKTFCKTLQKESKKDAISASKSLDLSAVERNMNRSNSGNPTPYTKPQQKLSKSISANLVTSENGQTKDLSLEEIRVETKPDLKGRREERNETEKDKNTSEKSENVENQFDSDRGKVVKRNSLEIPPHRTSNKFLPNTPHKPLATSEEIQESSHSNKELEDAAKKKQITEQLSEGKGGEDDTKILRSKSKSSKEETGGRHSKQRRYSPLDITRLAGRLFDAFSTFSTSEERLTEDPIEEALAEARETELHIPESGGTNDLIPPDISPPPDNTLPDTTVKENLKVLPPLSLEDLTPEVGETVVEKNAKRMLRKYKRQATVIESREVLQARVQKEDVTHEDESIHLDSSTPEEVYAHSAQDSISSVTGSESMEKAPEALKQPKREKTGMKINHKIKSLSAHQRNESALTSAHSVEDVWQELQRMKATVRTHHSLANRFAQDYPVMRRCFETQSQTVRKLERIQHTRSRDVEKELQDKLALMEGYLVQTMRENADLRSKVWGLTTRLTQLEVTGSSSRPSSILSFSDVHRRDHLGIQDISKHKRTLKLKKFFGEEPPPLLEEIPTSFTHDTSKEDDEIV